MKFKSYLVEKAEPFLKTEKEVRDWIGIHANHITTDLIVKADGTVDVTNGISINDTDINRLRVKFNKISGYFNFKNNELKTLEGCPVEVGLNFDCSNNPLKSLVGGPKKVGGNYSIGSNFAVDFIRRNPLKSLVGCASFIGGDFFCNAGKLTSFEGAPEHVVGSVYIVCNKIPSFHNVHKQFKRIDGTLNLIFTKQAELKNSILGFLMIEGLKDIVIAKNNNRRGPLWDAFKILEKHFENKSKETIFECQQEMIDAGLEEFAKL